MPTVDTYEVVVLDMLTQDSVSVITKQMTKIDSKELQIGENHRRAFVNSTKGREEIQQYLSNPYLSSVMELWGPTPTVEELTIDTTGSEIDDSI